MTDRARFLWLAATALIALLVAAMLLAQAGRCVPVHNICGGG